MPRGHGALQPAYIHNCPSHTKPFAPDRPAKLANILPLNAHNELRLSTDTQGNLLVPVNLLICDMFFPAAPCKTLCVCVVAVRTTQRPALSSLSSSSWRGRGASEHEEQTQIGACLHALA